MSMAVPISYLQFNVVNGYALAAPGGTATATLSAGICFDSLNVTQLQTTATTTINAANNGVNGLDTGTIATSTWYAVFVIGDSRRFNPTAAIISLSYTTPLLPAGYDSYRRVGYLLTDGSSHFLLFYQSLQSSTGGARQYLWDVGIQVLNGGTSTTAAAVDLETAMPVAALPVLLNLSFLPNAAGDKAYLQVYGSSATIAAATAPVVVTAEAVHLQYFPPFQFPTALHSSNPAVQYAVTASGALTIYGIGFVDIL